MPWLVSIADYKLGERHHFESVPITIGRLSKNEVAIKHKQISREHAKIVAGPGESSYLIEDLNSMNYVYVNRKQTIREALEHGDLINVGGVADFLFLLEEDETLALEILEKLKADPEYSPANFALKKTMASLVDELSQSQIHIMGEQGQLSSPGIQGGLEDIESLYEIAYTINSCLDLSEVLKIIVNKVLDVTGAERGFVMLKPADRDLHPGAAGSTAPPLEVKIARGANGDLEGADRESFSKSIVLKAIESGDTYVSTNAAEDPVMQTRSVINYAIREAMCAPLRVRDDIIGTIYVDTRQVKGNFTKRDILFFEAICHQAAIALSNARMTEDLRSKQVQLQKAYADLLDRSKRLSLAKKIVEQKVKELSALNAVASGINMGGDLDTMLRLVLEKSVDVLSAEWGVLKLVSEEDDFLYTQVEVGGHGKQMTKKLPLTSKNIWTQTLDTEKPIMAVRGDEDRSQWLPNDPDVSIVMAVPLVHNRRKIGVIGIFNPRHKRPFAKEEVTLAVSLAGQAAVTIENVRLYNLAIYDGLTKLHLRRYFDIWLQKEFDRTRRYKGKLSLVLIDLDHFKNVNDQYGHQCGDEVLRITGALIKDSIRSVDLGARYGGEEFAVILPETDLEGAMLFADRLRARVESTPIRWDARLFPITFSGGVATYSGERDLASPEELIERADKSLYRSKENGRNQITSYRQAFLGGVEPTPEAGPAQAPPPREEPGMQAPAAPPPQGYPPQGAPLPGAPPPGPPPQGAPDPGLQPSPIAVSPLPPSPESGDR